MTVRACCPYDRQYRLPSRRVTLHLISGLEPILRQFPMEERPNPKSAVMPPAPAGGITVQSAGGKEIADPL